MVRVVYLTMACVLTVFSCATAQPGGDGRSLVVIVEDSWSSNIIAEMAKIERESGRLRVTVEPDMVRLKRFTEGQCGMVAWTDYPSTVSKGEWFYGFKRQDIEPTAVVVGEAKVAVIVNLDNHVEGLSVSQIRMALVEDGNERDWADVGGSRGRVKCYGEALKAPTSQILQKSCMQYEKMVGTYPVRCFYSFRKDIVVCANSEEIIKSVARDRHGIGFVLFDGKPIKGVRTVPVRSEGGGALVPPKEGSYIQKDYALSQQVILYVHPSKPAEAVEFAEFAVGPEGSRIAEKYGLATPYMQKLAEGGARLMDAKGGQGAKVLAIGARIGGKATPDWGADYVRAKTVLQIGFIGVDSDAEAMSAFLAGGTASHEMLFLGDRPSDKALGTYGGRWSELNPSNRGTQY